MSDNKSKININKQDNNLERLVFNMLQRLSKRPRDIIIKRFNLNGKGVKTLEEIGKEYGITRERVRQIEAEAISRLRKIGKEQSINSVFNYVAKIIKSSGGIATEEKITNCLLGKKEKSRLNRQIALLILSLDDKIKKAKETRMHKKLYFYDEKDIARFKEVIDGLEKHIKKIGKSVDFKRMVAIVNNITSSKNLNTLSEKSIKSYLEANKVILENVLGKWGHKKWPDVNPRGTRDKAYLALKKSKKPLHFTEITNKINAIWFNEKKANSQTVHNELIKDNRFVLIGRGIYALKEWGYKPGTVLDVIIEILKENKGKMEQDKIIQEVLKRRLVKKNTIILNLQNKKYFEKLGNKTYRLKKEVAN